MTELDYSRLSHEQQRDLRELVTSRGLGPREVCARFEVTESELRLRIYLLQDGQKYYDPELDDMATRLLVVPIEEAPAWLQPNRSMGE